MSYIPRRAKAAIPVSEEFEHKCWAFLPIGKTERNDLPSMRQASAPEKLKCKAHIVLEEEAQALKRDATERLQALRSDQSSATTD